MDFALVEVVAQVMWVSYGTRCLDKLHDQLLVEVLLFFPSLPSVSSSSSVYFSCSLMGFRVILLSYIG